MVYVTTPGNQHQIVDDVEQLLLQVTGGGFNTAQVRHAMRLRAELDEKGKVEFNQWIIERSAEQADDPSEA